MRQYPRPRPGRSEKVLPDPIENRPEPSLTCTHGTAASRPKGLAMLLFALLLAPSMPGLAAEPHADQPKAIALIEKHRGKVGFDEKRPGRPVVSVQVGNLEFDDSALAHLAGLTQLQELDLSMTGVTDAGLKHLKGFPQLEVLHLSGSYVTDEGLPQIKALARLRVLGLALTNVTEAGTAQLKGLSRLQALDLGITRVGDDGLEHLAGLTGLRQLGLSSADITDVGLEHLKGLTQLRVLSLAGNEITDAGLKHLEGLTQLRVLDLNDNRVTDAGLKHLKGLTGLQELDLRACAIRGPGLAHLGRLRQLRSLDLQGTQLKDEALAPIRGLEGLETLNLHDTRISDAGLKHLRGLAKLANLDLSLTSVSDAGARELRTALPGAHVVHSKGQADRDPDDVDFSAFGDITVEWKSFGIQTADEMQELQRKLVEEAKAKGEPIEKVLQQYYQKTQAEFLDRARRANKSSEEYGRFVQERYLILGQVMRHRAEPLYQGRFTIGGTVVDQDGNPLSGVKVRVQKSEHAGEQRVGVVQFKVTTPFEIKVDGGAKLSLTFEKPGYYPVDDQTVSVPVPQRIDTPEILANKPVARPVVEKRDLRIVMEKQGKLVKLQQFSAWLEHCADGSGVVLDLDSPTDKPPFASYDKKVASLASPETLPRNCLYLLSQAEKENRSASAAVQQKGGPVPVPRPVTRLPITVRLLAAGSDSGFVTVTPPNPFRPFRTMKEAPREGYQREIVLEAPTNGSQAVFYFKLHGKYGKGQLCNIQLRQQGTASVVASLVVWLQPDGSRNLESMQCWW